LASSNWKKVELELCRELGSERTGPMGRDLPDCVNTPGIGVEIKAYKKFVFLTEDWQQAVDNAEKLGLIPVLVVREGGRGGRRMVQLREKDYGSLWGPSGLRPLKIHVQGVPLGLIRLDWADFVRMYRAYLDKKESLGS
jgi:hypothetical protein